VSSPKTGSIDAVELIVGDGGVDIGAALSGSFTLAARSSQDLQRTYYDSFDGLLHGAGLALWYEPGRLFLSSNVGEREPLTARIAAAPLTPLALESLPPGPLHDTLAAVVHPRVLFEIARIELRVEEFAVLDDIDKTVVRLQTLSPLSLPDRIRLVPMRGYRRELLRVAELLGACDALRFAREPLLDQVVSHGGGRAAGRSNAIDVAIAADEAAGVAAARILARLNEVLAQNLPGVLGDVDIEFLHDYRVALRRIRTVVRELRGVLPAARYPELRRELRWLQSLTSPTRDLDVYLEEFEDLRAVAPDSMQADLDPLLDVLRERQLQARLEMVRALRGERAQRLRTSWEQLVDALPGLPIDDRPDAGRAVGPLSAERIRRVHRRMVRMGRMISAESPPQAYHDLRKLGKELRYLLELFGRPLHDPEVVQEQIRALKSLQDVLGRHQDREVQIEMLRSLSGIVGQEPSGSGALLAMGAMIDRLEEQAAAARSDFHERFEQFASSTQRRLVRETFGP
jgi:CHAD domain-containing protein